MKKYSIILAAAALVFAACNKAEIDAPSQDVNPSVETELITVELNAVTKTQLGANGATTWSSKDAVSVSVGGTSIGTLTLVEGSTFKGEITAGYDGSTSVTLNYPAGVTAVPTEQAAVAGSFANGAALLEVTTTVDALRAGDVPNLENKTALLQFSVAQAGDVTFKVGTTEYKVTGCQTNQTYYACVAPVDATNLSYTIGEEAGTKSKTNITFIAGKIYKLGNLTNKVRFYVETEKTPFDIYLYTYDELNVRDAGDWPGAKLTWDSSCNKYYYDLPSSTLNKAIKYIVNNNGQYESSSTDCTLSAPEVNVVLKLKWLYFKPSSNWKEGNAWFAAYFYTDNNGEYWSNLVGPRADGVYGVVVPNDHKMVIFTRMDSGKPYDKSWDAKWNQTANLTVPTDSKNYFKCTEGWWDAHNGDWSTYSF